MALSNKFGSIVLTTGNKSEMAVGYCNTIAPNMCISTRQMRDFGVSLGLGVQDEKQQIFCGH